MRFHDEASFHSYLMKNASVVPWEGERESSWLAQYLLNILKERAQSRQTKEG
ncbi:hypothetical protein EMIT07CA2_200065 [Brevibacillus sp. IT-7CA2]